MKSQILAESADPWAPRAHAALRIVTGYLFLLHGGAKLLGFPHVASFDHLSIASLVGIAGLLELVGGALVLIGLFVRPVAFVLSGEMAVAYFMAHASKGNPLLPLLNQGEGAVLYCFIFLFLAAAGAGLWSVDSARRGRAEAVTLRNACKGTAPNAKAGRGRKARGRLARLARRQGQLRVRPQPCHPRSHIDAEAGARLAFGARRNVRTAIEIQLCE